MISAALIMIRSIPHEKLPNFKITNYDRNGMARKSTYHELSKFGIVC